MLISCCGLWIFPSLITPVTDAFALWPLSDFNVNHKKAGRVVLGLVVTIQLRHKDQSCSKQ